MINLETIKSSLRLRMPDIPLGDDGHLIDFFNYFLREINRELRAKFPQLPRNYDITEPYPHLPEGQENLFIDGIIYQYQKDDDADSNIVNQHYGIYFQNMQALKQQYRVPVEWQKTAQDYETKTWGWDNTYSSEASLKLQAETLVFFRNQSLLDLYEKKEIKNEDLSILAIKPDYWHWLKAIRVSPFDQSILPTPKTFNIPLTYNNISYNVDYDCPLEYKGVVFKAHQSEIIQLLFKPNTPKGILKMIWRTKT